MLQYTTNPRNFNEVETAENFNQTGAQRPVRQTGDWRRVPGRPGHSPVNPPQSARHILSDWRISTKMAKKWFSGHADGQWGSASQQPSCLAAARSWGAGAAGEGSRWREEKSAVKVAKGRARCVPPGSQ